MFRSHRSEADSRKYARFPKGGKAEISWSERGNAAKVTGRLVDRSGTGLRIKVPRHIDPGTSLVVVANGMYGSGTVRYCKSRLFSYQIGVEVRGQLQPLIRGIS